MSPPLRHSPLLLIAIGLSACPSAPTSLPEGSVSLSPAAPTTLDDLSASFSADPGLSQVLRLVWARDGVDRPELGATVPALETARDERWSVRLELDLDGAISVLDETSVVIANTAPTLSGARIEPLPVRPEGPASCLPDDTADVDGDDVVLERQWWIDGAEAGTSEDLEGPFPDGATLRCQLTPDDGTDQGSPVSVEVIVEGVVCDEGYQWDGANCVDILECAVDNGGCGDPAHALCVEQEGAPPICEDLDACLVDNGGCGDPAFIDCLDQPDGAPPVCQDIAECAVDNGGCGDPAFYACEEQLAAAPLCTYLVDEFAFLTDGVTHLEPGGTPSRLVAIRAGAFPVVLDANDNAMVMAGDLGDGRLVGFGHESWLRATEADGDDRHRLLANAAQWSARTLDPMVGVTTGGDTLDALATHGLLAEELDWSDLSAYDTIIAESWNDYDDATLQQLSDWAAAGGGLILGGHAWYWGYSNEDPANHYSGNKISEPAGILWSTSYGSSDSWWIPDSHPGPLHNAAEGALAMLAHLDGSAALSLDEQRLAAQTIGRALSFVPLRFTDLYDPLATVRGFYGELRPTWSSPVRPDDQPIETLLLRYDTALATQLPAAELSAHESAEDFPGLVDPGAARVTSTLNLLARYDGMSGRFGYAAAGKALWRSTGTYAAPGELITVTVPPAAAAAGLALRIGAHTDTLWNKDEIARFPQISRSWPIEAEVSEVGSMFGGLIYLEVPADVDLGEIEVVLEGVVQAPWFQLGSDTDSDWSSYLRDRPAPWGELGSDSFVMSLASDDLAAVESPETIMGFWQDALDLSADLAGIPRDRPRAERFVVDTQISAGYGHSGYPLMAYPDWTEGALSTEGSWGLFHEIGHNHQNLDWVLPGSTECSVNLWSVYLYEELVGVSRDDAHPAIDPADRASRIDSYLAGGADFWADWSVWTCLETHLQIQEGFGWTPYFDVFADYLTIPEGDRPGSDQERIDAFALALGYATGADLGPFFLAWGWPLDPAVQAELALLPFWPDNPMP